MDKERAKLLPDGEPGRKRIRRKQTDKENRQDTQNPRQPIKQSDRRFHFVSLFSSGEKAYVYSEVIVEELVTMRQKGKQWKNFQTNFFV